MSEEKFLNKYRIASARAPWHIYNGGIYFVTICTKNKEHYFGKIANGEMQLSIIGQIAEKCWKEIPQHFPHVEIPIWVVMPNHIHGIIVIASPAETQCCMGAQNIVGTQNIVETQNFASLRRRRQRRQQQQCQNTNKFGPQSKNLASVIRGFKIGVTKYARQNNIPFAWQPRFYDRIVRNNDELNRIAIYIEQNIEKWDMHRRR